MPRNPARAIISGPGILTDGSIAPSRACGRCSLGRAWQFACACDQQAPRKTDGDRVSWSARLALQFHTPCTGHASGRAAVFALAEISRLCGPRRPMAGAPDGATRRHWFQRRKQGGMRCLKTPDAVTSTLLDQAHNAIDRKFL